MNIRTIAYLLLVKEQISVIVALDMLVRTILNRESLEWNDFYYNVAKGYGQKK
jgi:hypothetical protein